MAQNVNWPIEAWAGLFSADPNDPNQNRTWSGLSDRVLGFRSQYGTQYELGTVEAGDCEIACLNKDEALNPANTGSAFNSGGNTLVPYRRIMGTATWPNGAGGAITGNLLNATNAAQWGQSTDTSTFEAGGLGEWTTSGTTPPTAANSSTRAQQGTKSMAITWPTAANGGTNAVSLVWAPFQGPFKIGQTYTLSLYLWAAAGVPKMRVQFGNVVSVSGTFASAWQRVTVTWTATDVWSAFQIYPDTNTTSGQQVWVDAVQVDIGSTASAYATTGPTIYPLFAGYIERYPLSWSKAGYLGEANLVCVDGNSSLARTELDDVLTSDIRQDTPRVTFTMGDAAGTATPQPAAWSVYTNAKGQPQAIGLGGVRPVFGTASSPSIDGGTCVAFAPASTTDFTVSYLSWNLALTGATSQAVEFWFQRSTQPSANEVILSGFTASNSGHPLEVGVNTSGQVFAREVNAPLTPTFYYTVTSGGSFCDGGWHHVVWTQSGTTSRTTNLYVDGVLAATTSTTPPGGLPPNLSALYVGGHFGTASSSPFTGNVAWVSVYLGITDARIFDHYDAGLGHAGDLPGVRLRRALTWAAWNGAQNVPDGRSPMGAASGYAGKTLADVGRDVAASENGYVLCTPDGDLVLVTRDSLYLKTTSTITLGENTAGGEVPYKGDVTFDMDPQFVYNAVEVTGGAGVTNGPVEDAASQARYFKSTLTVSTQLAELTDLAQYQQHLLNRFKDARVRVQTVTLDPASNPSVWPTALGVRFGDRVTVKRRTAVFTMSSDYFVTSVAHETGPGKWLTRLQMVPVDPSQAWILGDATYGLLGTTTIPVW